MHLCLRDVWTCASVCVRVHVRECLPEREWEVLECPYDILVSRKNKSSEKLMDSIHGPRKKGKKK